MWFKYHFVRALPTDARELELLAQELGVSLFETAAGGAGITATNTYEVQKRIMEALRYRRESWTWLFAFIAALASFASALAAWIAAGHSN